MGQNKKFSPLKTPFYNCTMAFLISNKATVEETYVLSIHVILFMFFFLKIISTIEEEFYTDGLPCV